MKAIPIEYGMFLRPKADGQALTWARSSVHGEKLHAADCVPYVTATLCGKGLIGTVEYATGTMCADCAKLLGIADNSTLQVDEQEHAWMAAQRTPAP